MDIIKLIHNSVFPKKCLGCNSWGYYLCSDCLNFISINTQNICPMCFRPSLDGITHFDCRQARGLDGLISIFIYRGIIKKAIQKLKYCFITDLGETILELFLSFCSDNKAFYQLVSQKNTLLAPVPLHKSRERWRGFNQSELLGKMIAQKLGIGFMPDLLIRAKKTKPQTKLAKKDRQKNIRKAFQINKNFSTSNFPPLTSRPSFPILLFDDVWTTGATIKECAQVLKRKGFAKVWALTLARQI